MIDHKGTYPCNGKLGTLLGNVFEKNNVTKLQHRKNLNKLTLQEAQNRLVLHLTLP